MYLRPLISAVLAVALSGPAFAATVTFTGGEVFIDSGNGYKPLLNSGPVKPGDVIMAKVGGTAEVVYDDGCRQAVEVGTVVTVGQASPCAVNAPPSDTTMYLIGGLAVATGVGLAIALSGDDSKSVSAE